MVGIMPIMPSVAIVVMAAMMMVTTMVVVVMMTGAMAAYERKGSLEARRAGRGEA